MSNDFLDDETTDDNEWSEFQSGPEQGDLKVLNDLVKRAAEVQSGIKKLENRIHV